MGNEPKDKHNEKIFFGIFVLLELGAIAALIFVIVTNDTRRLFVCSLAVIGLLLVCIKSFLDLKKKDPS
jgi:hypothetical protein